MKNFRTYQLSKQLYQQTKTVKLKGELKDQLHRASLGICLNLAEGYGKNGEKDRKRFYFIALGSCREVQALVELENLTSLSNLSDQLGAHLYRLYFSS
jgi:four helix bundle protein